MATNFAAIREAREALQQAQQEADSSIRELLAECSELIQGLGVNDAIATINHQFGAHGLTVSYTGRHLPHVEREILRLIDDAPKTRGANLSVESMEEISRSLDPPVDVADVRTTRRMMIGRPEDGIIGVGKKQGRKSHYHRMVLTDPSAVKTTPVPGDDADDED